MTDDPRINDSGWCCHAATACRGIGVPTTASNPEECEPCCRAGGREWPVDTRPQEAADE